MKRTFLSLALPFIAGASAAGATTPFDAESEADNNIERIRQLDDAGPQINSVIVYDADAAEKAGAAADTGYLRGRTVLVKDNIETAEWATTAGSLALKGNITGRDAPMIVNLRKSGGVVLGKTNLSEWANIRDDNSTSGWSAIGGLTRNPHAIDRNSCGSSAGSGAAVAAGFAWAAIGTETDGSITCPSSVNGVVGFKPTVGMVSRTHVVPISHSQDTAGPMANSVSDAAMLLTALAGSDSTDSATTDADLYKGDFTQGLADASLKGVRIGILKNQIGSRADVRGLFDAALADLTRAGAVLVEVDFTPDRAMYRDEFVTLLFELRDDMQSYLAGLPGEDLPRTLADLIAFNKANASVEMRWFGQSIFEQAEGTTDREAYETARKNAFRLAGPEGIDKLLAENNVAFLIAPTTGPAWASDLVHGDNYSGGIGAGSLAAISGYPHLTVPMGAVEGLPVGLSIMSGKWRDHEVLKAGAAYEKARTTPLATPSFERWKPANSIAPSGDSEPIMKK